MILPKSILRFLLAGAYLLTLPSMAFPAETGLITKPSNYSVQATIERFESAVTARGWVVFTQLDHAAAANRVGLELRPRTVVVFGNPKIGTGPMQKAPTLAIDVPLKALIWQDDQGKVWLTYNSSEYLGDTIYSRHGLMMSSDARNNLGQFLNDVTDQVTK
jgi:uncharacterized protein (DUF302 family)